MPWVRMFDEWAPGTADCLPMTKNTDGVWELDIKPPLHFHGDAFSITVATIEAAWGPSMKAIQYVNKEIKS